MQLTANFKAYVTKDGGYFAIAHVDNSEIDGGYKLGGEKAYFEDEGKRYSVAVFEGDEPDHYKIEMQQVKLKTEEQ
jgi:hypothetical protein